MIRERSVSRLEKIRREYNFLLIITLIWLLFFSAVLIGNPFDFIYPLQYVPAVIYIICFLMTLASLIKGFKHINADLNNASLEASLRRLVSLYENPGKFKRWAGHIFLFCGVLFSLSFLPSLIRGHGLLPAIGIIAVQVLTAGCVFVMALKAGVFRERHGAKFKEELEELKELRATSVELTAEERRL